MFGFITGTIYINIFAKTSVLSMGILDEYFLKQYTVENLNNNEYIWYIARVRIVPIIMLSLLANTNIRVIAGVCCLVWTGFSFGLIFTAAILKMGLKGVLLCIIAIIPHFICYIVTYVILMIYIFSYPNVTWNYSKTICMLLFILLGIITEAMFNPVLMDLFIKMI